MAILTSSGSLLGILWDQLEHIQANLASLDKEMNHFSGIRNDLDWKQ